MNPSTSGVRHALVHHRHVGCQRNGMWKSTLMTVIASPRGSARKPSGPRCVIRGELGGLRPVCTSYGRLINRVDLVDRVVRSSADPTATEPNASTMHSNSAPTVVGLFIDPKPLDDLRDGLARRQHRFSFAEYL